MKKFTISVLAVCSAISMCFAGGEDSKGFVSVSVGAGIPTGNFGKKDTLAHTDTTHRTGFATTGFHFNISGGYRFAKNVGAMIMVGGNMNGFDVATFSSINQIKSPATLTATSNYIGSYLVGPFFSFPASDKLDFTVRVLVGLMTANTSALTETNGSSSLKETYVNSSSFAYNAGIGLKYNTSKKLGLLFNVDYLGGTPVTTTITDTPSSGSAFTSGGHKYAMSTGLINISVGASLGF